MKRLIAFLLLAGLGFAAGAFLMVRRQANCHARELETQRAAWQAEKAELEAALQQAQAQARSLPASVVVPAAAPVPGPTRPLPAEIIARLQALRPPVPSAQLREAVYWLEGLAQAGPTALPAIRQFLARNVDIELDTAWLQSRAARDGKLPGDFVLPPSLRMGLLDVVRRIGGADGEKLLVDTLGTTGRGLEVAYLTRLLQEMAPNQYRDAALSAARALLAGAPLNSSGPLDRYHRDYLFNVLSFYGDTGFASEAQVQLLRADMQIDRSALKYLQQTLGAQAVPIAAQAYYNPMLQTNAVAKEPLARLALTFAGADALANEFYQKAINDPVLTKGHRSNLIEDLNEDGFPDPKNLTANDLPLIQNRIALIEQLAPNAMDEVNAAAFKEAYKDLLNMRAKVAGQPAPAR